MKRLAKLMVIGLGLTAVTGVVAATQRIPGATCIVHTSSPGTTISNDGTMMVSDEVQLLGDPDKVVRVDCPAPRTELTAASTVSGIVRVLDQSGFGATGVPDERFKCVLHARRTTGTNAYTQFSSPVVSNTSFVWENLNLPATTTNSASYHLVGCDIPAREGSAGPPSKIAWFQITE